MPPHISAAHNKHARDAMANARHGDHGSDSDHHHHSDSDNHDKKKKSHHIGGIWGGVHSKKHGGDNESVGSLSSDEAAQRLADGKMTLRQFEDHKKKKGSWKLKDEDEDSDGGANEFLNCEAASMAKLTEQLEAEVAEFEKNVLPTLDAIDRKNLDEAFTLFDVDGSGRIDLDELRVCMKSLGIEMSAGGCRKIIETFGDPKSRDIHIGAFRLMMHMHFRANVKEVNLKLKRKVLVQRLCLEATWMSKGVECFLFIGQLLAFLTVVLLMFESSTSYKVNAQIVKDLKRDTLVANPYGSDTIKPADFDQWMKDSWIPNIAWWGDVQSPNNLVLPGVLTLQSGEVSECAGFAGEFHLDCVDADHIDLQPGWNAIPFDHKVTSYDADGNANGMDHCNVDGCVASADIRNAFTKPLCFEQELFWYVLYDPKHAHEDSLAGRTAHMLQDEAWMAGAHFVDVVINKGQLLAFLYTTGVEVLTTIRIDVIRQDTGSFITNFIVESSVAATDEQRESTSGQLLYTALYVNVFIASAQIAVFLFGKARQYRLFGLKSGSFTIMRKFQNSFMQWFDVASATFVICVAIINMGILDASHAHLAELPGLDKELKEDMATHTTLGQVPRQKILMFVEDFMHDADSMNNYKLVLTMLLYVFFFRVINYISLHPRLGVLVELFQIAAFDLLHFVIIFMALFFMLAFVGYALMGSQDVAFHTFGTAVYWQYRMIMGDWPFQFTADPLMMHIYLLTYGIVIFFALLNVFLAIIVDAYAATKENNAEGWKQTGFFSDLFYLYYYVFGRLYYGWPSPVAVADAIDDLNEEIPLTISELGSHFKNQQAANKFFHLYWARFSVDLHHGEEFDDDDESSVPDSNASAKPKEAKIRDQLDMHIGKIAEHQRMVQELLEKAEIGGATDFHSVDNDGDVGIRME